MGMDWVYSSTLQILLLIKINLLFLHFKNELNNQIIYHILTLHGDAR